MGDVTGDVGVGIQTKFDVTIARLTYGYDIFKDTKKELGILAGMHVTSANVKFQTNLGIGTGLRFYRFRVEDTGFSDRDSRFDYDFFGPVVYGSFSF